MVKLWAFKNSEYDLIETYLNDMSEEGKAFKKKFLGFVSFEETDTKEYVYATAYRTREASYHEIKQAWEAEGWNYLCRIDNVLIFKSLRSDYCKKASRVSIHESYNAWKDAYSKASMIGIFALLVCIGFCGLAAVISTAGLIGSEMLFATFIFVAAAIAMTEPIVKWALLKERSPEDGLTGDIDACREHISKIQGIHVFNIVALIVACVGVIGLCAGELEFYTGLEYGPIPEGSSVDDYINMAEEIGIETIATECLDFLLAFGQPIIKILIFLGVFKAIKKKSDSKKEKKRQDLGESDLSRRLSEFREAREAEKIRRADNSGERIGNISYNYSSFDADDEYEEEFEHNESEKKSNDNTSDTYEDSVEEGEYHVETEFDPASWDASPMVESVTDFFEKDLQMKGVAEALKKADIDTKMENAFKKIGKAHEKYQERVEQNNKNIEKKSNKIITFVMFSAIFIIAITAVSLVFSSQVALGPTYESCVDEYYDAPYCTMINKESETMLYPSYGHWWKKNEQEYGGSSSEWDFGYDFENMQYDWLYIDITDEAVEFSLDFEPAQLEVRAWNKDDYFNNPNLDSNYTLIQLTNDGNEEMLNKYRFEVVDDDKIYCIYAVWDEEYYNGECYYPFAVERINIY